jgi:hypothetical protein
VSICENAKLNHANLRGADLRGALLDGADLTNAELRDAKIDGASFRDAVLNGTHVEGVNFRNAIHLSSKQIAAAETDTGNTLGRPNGDTTPLGAMETIRTVLSGLNGANLQCAPTKSIFAERLKLFPVKDDGSVNSEAAMRAPICKFRDCDQHHNAKRLDGRLGVSRRTHVCC